MPELVARSQMQATPREHSNLTDRATEGHNMWRLDCSQWCVVYSLACAAVFLPFPHSEWPCGTGTNEPYLGGSTRVGK